MPDELYLQTGTIDTGAGHVDDYTPAGITLADVRRLVERFHYLINHRSSSKSDQVTLAPFAALLKEKNDAQT
jgi:hypothetical protein